MTQSEHQRARQLVARGASHEEREDTGGEQAWLRSHLQVCADCREYAEVAGRLVLAVRSQPLAADSGLVRATQMCVRMRAPELQRRPARVWMIWICCIAVTLGTVLPTAILWRGFAWIGQHAQLSVPLWQLGAVVFALVPALVAGVALLPSGTYLADHNGSLPD